MRAAIRVTIALMMLSWTAAAIGDTSTSDVSTQLENNHINIRSMLDPDLSVSKSQAVSLILPDKPSIADKQLFELVKVNLDADNFNVASPDKSMWTLVARVQDQSSELTYGESAFLFFGTSSKSATVNYASLTLTLYRTGDLTTPVWTSSVTAFNDYWVMNQELVVQAILATYGVNFYYQDVRPVKVPDYVKNNTDQPPTLDQIKKCLADPKEAGC